MRRRTRSPSPWARFALLVLLVAAMVGATVVARRRGYSGMGGNTVVRCRQGHLFTTLWVPGVSVKAIRLGWARFQYCPVGRHWTLVTPAKETELSEEQLVEAHGHRDIRLP